MTTPFPHAYDPEAHAGYVTIRDTQVTETIDLGGNVLIDLDKDGNAIGFELLDVRSEAAVTMWASALALIARGGE